MSVTRRDILKLAGGSFLGMFLTPMPWKLLDDTAIWTQNWSLIPPVPRGPITLKYSACTLCAGGCAVKARCVNGHPFGLTGVPHHPINNGILCPVGLSAHHLPYHPLRLTEPCRFSGRKNDSTLASAPLDEIIAEISAAIHNNEGKVAVLDQRPGRMISNMYRQFLATCSNGLYLLPPSQETATLHTIKRMSGAQQELGFDFENTRVILSFGAQLFDGWGTAGRMSHLLNRRKETGLQIIQAESNQSRTALQANTWLPVKPGGESALAMGIANVIVREGLYPVSVKKNVKDFEKFETTAHQFTPQFVADLTGIPADQIVKTAEEIAQNPSIILAGCDAGGGPLDNDAGTAIASLNILVGNVGRKGGIVLRNQLPGTIESDIPAQLITNIPDHSINVLIIDGAESGYAIPWQLIERKLVPDKSLVVSLAPYMTPLAAHADVLVPAPAQFESVEELITPGDARVASFSLATPLTKKSEKSVEPIEFLHKLAEASGGVLNFNSTEEMLKQRVQEIFAERRGFVFSSKEGNSTNLADISSADEFWTALTEGGCWIDEECSTKSNLNFTILDEDIQLTSHITDPRGDGRLVLMPRGWKGTTATASLSPIMSKVFQESNLRDVAGRVALNPVTAAENGLENGAEAALRTKRGEMTVRVQVDASVMPGVISAAVGPSPNKSETREHTNGEGVLDLCTLNADGTWRLTQATIAQS